MEVVKVKIGKGTSLTPAEFTIPDGNEPFPAVMLIHEIWGLNPNIQSIAKRFAGQGFAVLAPDLLSGTGIIESFKELHKEMMDPATKDEAQKKMRTVLAPIMSPEYAAKTVGRLGECFKFLKKDKRLNGNIAAVGFCYGGTYSFALACHEPELKAAVPFYGHAPQEGEIAGINCSILAFYGEKDSNLINGLPELQASMKKHGKDFTCKVYPDCGHAFFNESNVQMYYKPAADDSWSRVLKFLEALR